MNVYTYNVFIPEEDDYVDNQQPEEAATAVKRQRYATRLYLFLLMGQ